MDDVMDGRADSDTDGDTGTGVDDLAEEVEAEAPSDFELELPAADQADVDAVLARVEAMCAADPELVHGDAVEMLALESPLPLAVSMCQQAMGFLPDTVRRRLVEAEFEDTIAEDRVRRAEVKATEDKARARSQKAAATRAATAARENAEASAKMASARCDRCFQVRTPAGTCGCD